MSDLEPVLRAIAEVRDEGRAREVKTDAMFAAAEVKTEARFTLVESRLADVASLGESNAKHIGELNGSLLRVASGAAKAVDLALEAKTQASGARDEATKIVESALIIHGASIAGSVNDVVKKAVEPLSLKIDSLEKNDEKQAVSLANQDTQLVRVVDLLSTLARWQNHWAVKAGIAVAGLVGAGVAGYFGAGH